MVISEEIVQEVKRMVESTGRFIAGVIVLEIDDNVIGARELYNITNDMDFVIQCMYDDECWKKWKDIRCSYPNNQYPCISFLWYLSHIKKDRDGYKVIRI